MSEQPGQPSAQQDAPTAPPWYVFIFKVRVTFEDDSKNEKQAAIIALHIGDALSKCHIWFDRQGVKEGGIKPTKYDVIAVQRMVEIDVW